MRPHFGKLGRKPVQLAAQSVEFGSDIHRVRRAAQGVEAGACILRM